MKNNQAGVGMIEVLILIVVIGLIGGVSWYVKSSKSTDSKESAYSANGPEGTSDVNKESTDSKTSDKLHDGAHFSLLYPPEWIAENEVEYSARINGPDGKIPTVTEGELPEWTHFMSPEYVPANDTGPSTKAGYWLEVRVGEAGTGDSYQNDLAKAKAASEALGGSYETITVDGQKAVLSDTKTHGTYWSVNVYKGNKNYLFRLNAPDEDKPEVKQLFASILGTVKLK